MLREAVLAAILLSVGLAGCLAPAGETVAPTASAASANMVGSIEDWHLLNMTATPDAALVGFRWVVPEGALVPDRVAEEYWGADETTIVLEATLILPEGKEDALTEWALLAFAREDGDLWPIGSVVSTPYEFKGLGLAAGEFEEESEAAPFMLRLGWPDLQVNDTVHFVLVARAEEPTPVAFAFRALPEDPGMEDAAEDGAAFLRARGERAPVEVAPSGFGAGFQQALFLEIQTAFLFPFGIELWTPAVEREGGISPDARPFAAVRDQTLGASFESAEGYAQALGMYFASTSIGEWSVEADIRGEALSAGGPIVHTPAFFPTMLVGYPAYVALSDGAGASESRLRIEAAAVDVGGYEFLVFDQLDLGASLTTLLGENGPSLSASGQGILEPGRQVAILPHGTDLHLLSRDGTARTYVGVLASA